MSIDSDCKQEKTDDERQKRAQVAVAAIHRRILCKRNADILIKVRCGVVVEYSDTDIVRF